MVNERFTLEAPQNTGLTERGGDALSPPYRLALAYAPAGARSDWTALLTLDRRFANVVATASEPMLAQIRLAWWREVFAKPVQKWPSGEPLLAALSGWQAYRTALQGLADGWEALVGEGPLDPTAFAALADGRARALAGLARVLGCRDIAMVERAGYRWALADMAIHLGDEAERGHVIALLSAADPVDGRIERAMRPLAVMRAMAERAAGEGRPIGGGGDLLAAIRGGLIGR